MPAARPLSTPQTSKAFYFVMSILCACAPRSTAGNFDLKCQGVSIASHGPGDQVSRHRRVYSIEFRWDEQTRSLSKIHNDIDENFCNSADTICEQEVHTGYLKAAMRFSQELGSVADGLERNDHVAINLQTMEGTEIIEDIFRFDPKSQNENEISSTFKCARFNP